MDKQNTDIMGWRRPIIDIPEAWRPNIEDLPGTLKWMAETIEQRIPGQGVRFTLLIAQVLGGQSLHIPRPDKWLIEWRNGFMRATYDRGGITVRELAGMTGLSTRQVENILSQPATQKELQDKQLRLF